MIHYITTNGIGNAWVANELRQVQRAGIPFVLHAMRKPSEDEVYHVADWAAAIHRNSVSIYPLHWPLLLLSMLVAPFLFGRRFVAVAVNALSGKRETLRARVAGIAHALVACHWARAHRNAAIAHIHSQWIHSCGTIAMYAAWLLDVPFSFTGHATDLFRDRVALVDKIRRADFIICISTFHRDFYLQHGASPEQLKIAYCGIDLDQFSLPDADQTRPRSHEAPLRIRSSGRLVAKKGFSHLVQACRILAERGVDFECTIGGSGPLESDLRDMIRRYHLEDRVMLTGQALKQEKIPEFMHGGDVYVLPCVWAPDNDVDGLPQMLMEAMACGLPAVSTRLVGIPDLVLHEQTGLLVEPEDADALADAIVRLGSDQWLRDRVIRNGLEHLRTHFDLATCLSPLIDEYRRLLPASGVPISEAQGQAQVSSEAALK